MDTYIHRGKLKGNSPLPNTDTAAIFSQVRSCRIADLPSYVSDESKAKYLTYPNSTDSTLAFPIFWEAAHASAKLNIELIKRTDNSSHKISLTFLTPLAADVVATINTHPDLRGSTENGYLGISPTSQYTEIRILPTSASPQVSSLTHNIRGIFHYTYEDNDGYLPDPRSFSLEGSSRATPSRVEFPTTSVTSYTQLHEDRTSHGINRGLDSVSKNVEDVYNQNTKPRIQYVTEPIILSEAPFVRGQSILRWVLGDGGKSCIAVAVDSTLVQLELPKIGGDVTNIYKFTNPDGTSLIRGNKRGDLDLSDIFGSPSEVFGEELQVISAHTRNGDIVHYEDDQIIENPSLTTQLIRTGGRYTFEPSNIHNCSMRFNNLYWVRVDEVTIAFLNEKNSMPVLAKDLAFGDILRITSEDGATYYYCVDYVPSVNRVIIRSTKDQTDLDMSDGVSGLQTLPPKLSMGNAGIDIIASPRSTLSSWVLLKLDNPVRVQDIEDFNSIHLRFPIASGKKTHGVYTDSKKDINSHLLLDYNLTEWLLRLQGPVSRELTRHINSNLQALTTAQALGQSVLNMNGCLVPSSLPQLATIAGGSTLQSEMDRNATSSSLNTYGMPVRAFKTTRHASTDRSPHLYFTRGILDTEHAGEGDVNYLNVHEVRSINKLDNLKFNPLTKVLHSWKGEDAPFNTTDLGRVLRIYNSTPSGLGLYQSKLYTVIEYINESRVRVRSVTPIDEYYPHYLTVEELTVGDAWIDTKCVFVSPKVAEQLSGLASLQRVDSEQGQGSASMAMQAAYSIKRPSTAAYPHTYNIQSKADGGGSRTLREIHSDTFNLTHVCGLLHLDKTESTSKIMLDIGNTPYGNAGIVLNKSIFRDSPTLITSSINVYKYEDSEIFKTLRHPNTTSQTILSIPGIDTAESFLKDLPPKYFGDMEICVTFEGSGAANSNSSTLLRDNPEIDSVSNMYRVREVTWNGSGGIRLELVSEIGGDAPIIAALERMEVYNPPQGNFYVVGNCTFYHEVARVGGLIPPHRNPFSGNPYSADNLMSGPSKTIDLQSQINRSVLQINTSTPYDILGGGIGLRMLTSDLSSGIVASAESSSRSLTIHRNELSTNKLLSKTRELSGDYTNALNDLVGLGANVNISDQGSRTLAISGVIDEMGPTNTWITDTLTTQRSDKFVKSGIADTSSGATIFKDTSKAATLMVSKTLPRASELNVNLIQEDANILMEPTVYISSARSSNLTRLTDSGLMGALSISIDTFSSNELRNTLSQNSLNNFVDFSLGLWTPLDLALHVIGDVKIDTGVFAIDTDTIRPNGMSIDHYNNTSEIYHRGNLGSKVMSGIGSSLVPVGDAGILPMSTRAGVPYWGSHKVYGELDGIALSSVLDTVKRTSDYDVWFAGNRYGQASSIDEAGHGTGLSSQRAQLLPIGRTSSTQILGEARTVSRRVVTINDEKDFFRMSFRAMDPSFIGNPRLGIADSDSDSSAGGGSDWDFRIPLGDSTEYVTDTDVGRQVQTIIVIDALLNFMPPAPQRWAAGQFIARNKGKVHYTGASLPIKVKLYPNDSLAIICTGVITSKDTSYLYVKGSDFGYLFEETGLPFWDTITSTGIQGNLNIQVTSILYGKRWDLNASAIAADCISLVSTGGDYNWVHTDPKVLFDNSGDADEVETSSERIDVLPFDETVRLSSGSGGSFFRTDLRVVEGSLISLSNTDLNDTKLRGNTHLKLLYPLRIQETQTTTPILESKWGETGTEGLWESRKPTLFTLVHAVIDPYENDLSGSSSYLEGRRSTSGSFNSNLQPLSLNQRTANKKIVYTRNSSYGIQSADYIMAPGVVADWLHTSTQVVVHHPEDVRVMEQRGTWEHVGGIVTYAGLVEFDLSGDKLKANNILAFKMSNSGHGTSTAHHVLSGVSGVSSSLAVYEKQAIVSGVSYQDNWTGGGKTKYKYQIDFKYMSDDAYYQGTEDKISWYFNPVVDQYGIPHERYSNRMSFIGVPRKGAHGYDTAYLNSWHQHYDDEGGRESDIVDYPKSIGGKIAVPSFILSNMVRHPGMGDGGNTPLYYHLFNFLGFDYNDDRMYTNEGMNHTVQDQLAYKDNGIYKYGRVPINLLGEYSFADPEVSTRNQRSKADIKAEASTFIFGQAARATPTKYHVKIPPASFKYVGKHVNISIPAFNEDTQFNPFLGAWSRKRKVMNPSEWALLWGAADNHLGYNEGGITEQDRLKLLSIPHLRAVTSYIGQIDQAPAPEDQLIRRYYSVSEDQGIASGSFGGYRKLGAGVVERDTTWANHSSLFFKLGLGLNTYSGQAQNDVGHVQTWNGIGDGIMGHWKYGLMPEGNGDNKDQYSLKIHDCDVVIYTDRTRREKLNNGVPEDQDIVKGGDLVGTYNVTDVRAGFSKTFTVVQIPGESTNYKWVEING